MSNTYSLRREGVKQTCVLLLLPLLTACVKIETFVPQGGQVGSEIEIIGSGFSVDAAENVVSFGGVVAEVVSASSERLRVRVPDGVARGKIKVSGGLLNSAESKTDFIPLPEYIQYKELESATLGTSQGYWIMHPPGFHDEGTTFPIVYALHGYNFARNPISAELGDLLGELNLTDLGGTNEHSWVFGVNRAGIYLPFLARSLMESSSVDELRTMLQERLAAVAGEDDLDHVDEVVESIIYYLPDNPDSWLSDIAEMVVVMPDGDNSFYTDRLGPPEGRNEEGLGAEPVFPTSTSINPSGRFDLHVTGWFERYILQDLIAHVEVEEIGVDKLVAEDKRRFIMGISMGGYGSLKLALKQPDKFVAVASLSTSPNLSADAIGQKNKFLPELLDIFGSAPLQFAASSEELEANVHLDASYLSQNNPIELVESLDEIDLQFFVEIGANDIIEVLGGGTLESNQGFINTLSDKGVTVEGGIVPAASGDEPDNGNASHSPEFWRTRLGAVLKFFSEAYEAE